MKSGGWFKDSYRHYLAAKYGSTGYYRKKGVNFDRAVTQAEYARRVKRLEPEVVFTRMKTMDTIRAEVLAEVRKKHPGALKLNQEERIEVQRRYDKYINDRKGYEALQKAKQQWSKLKSEDAVSKLNKSIRAFDSRLKGYGEERENLKRRVEMLKRTTAPGTGDPSVRESEILRLQREISGLSMRNADARNERQRILSIRDELEGLKEKKFVTKYHQEARKFKEKGQKEKDVKYKEGGEVVVEVQPALPAPIFERKEITNLFLKQAVLKDRLQDAKSDKERSSMERSIKRINDDVGETPQFKMLNTELRLARLEGRPYAIARQVERAKHLMTTRKGTTGKEFVGQIGTSQSQPVSFKGLSADQVEKLMQRRADVKYGKINPVTGSKGPAGGHVMPRMGGPGPVSERSVKRFAKLQKTVTAARVKAEIGEHPLVAKELQKAIKATHKAGEKGGGAEKYAETISAFDLGIAKGKFIGTEKKIVGKVRASGVNPKNRDERSRMKGVLTGSNVKVTGVGAEPKLSVYGVEVKEDRGLAAGLTNLQEKNVEKLVGKELRKEAKKTEPF